MLLKKLHNSRLLKAGSLFIIFTLGSELVYPTLSFALTSGPSQPEVMSFEPVGTTDMVDLFTGDFVYNIPLLDIDGYPINISYHGGIDMEQEASWVGLGWNINPGAMNRGLRGIPDDFKGDVIEKNVNIKAEENIRVGLGAGIEAMGLENPIMKLTLDAALAVNHSNYRGYSADFNVLAGINVAGFFSSGINLGVSSATGADIDYNWGVQLSSKMVSNSDIGIGVGYSQGAGYNSRTAAKDKFQSASVTVTHAGRNVYGKSATKTVPIGLNNIVPVVTNVSSLKMYKGRIKIGGEALGSFTHAGINGMYSVLSHEKNGSRPSYGYLYLQNSTDNSILDFTRDKEGNFNETMNYLPLGNMTYDVFTATGQGNSGSFRAFRNDIGSVFDPVTTSSSDNYEVSAEAGFGAIFEVGSDITISETVSKSGPWKEQKKQFTAKKEADLYEPVYFKTAGELTYTDHLHNNTSVIKGSQAVGLPNIMQANPKNRNARGNLMTYFTNSEASKFGVASMSQIEDYNTVLNFANGNDTLKRKINRNHNGRKDWHIGEVVQAQTDGSRYIYGIAAMNTNQKEKVFTVNPSNDNTGLVTVDNTTMSVNNKNGRDNYFSETVTPAYAHSYLLTSVLSPDYVDVSGDGPSDDDLGTFTKLNYSLKNENFKWRAPFQANKANYNAGLKSDPNDDKGTVIEGSKEIWMLNSIESKNNVAEFYVSPRLDGKGTGANDVSYKLDSIALYNKNDRLQNGLNAIPIKTVYFDYNYELCPGTPNAASGKLTLKSIYFKYGLSEKSMISPYKFEYNNATNYNYNVAAKNRWGIYKPNNVTKPNSLFPHVDKNDSNQDQYASAWNLSKILLPSGGEINVEYESDDYAYVQNKKAMDLFFIQGIGNSNKFRNGNFLYENLNAPNLYIYFKRDKELENDNTSLHAQYLGNQKILSYVFDIDVARNNYEAIKGYAEIEEVGYCENNINSPYGYIKLKSANVKMGSNKSDLNPITYNAINFSRYYLPDVLYNGGGTTLGDFLYAFKELISIFKNPVLRLINENKSKKVKLETSFVRLNNISSFKKGGGHRVKQLLFKDNWSSLSDDNNIDAQYGKRYHYTIEENGRMISSGVASYEPLLGSEDNPFKFPIPYETQRGSNFPPNDPIGLYQELPLGESLYPSPVVGYSRVVSESIHKNVAASAQNIEIAEFYTAKDFPIIVKTTELSPNPVVKDIKWNKQIIHYTGDQGFTLVFNDMHGKPKKTESRILKPNKDESELISYQLYKYYSLGSKIPVMEFDDSLKQFIRTERVLGQEVDLMIDSREKIEETNTETSIVNFNLFTIGIIPIPLLITPPIGGYKNYYRNQFNSVVATKIVQQYGLVSSIEAYNEGAITKVNNEVFDPMTGKALITYVNNEYKDLEYTTQVPAYMVYNNMSPSYKNIGYEESFDKVEIKDGKGILPTSFHTSANYYKGDEILISYVLGGKEHTNNVWVMDVGEISTPRLLDSILNSIQCKTSYNSIESFINEVRPFGSGTFNPNIYPSWQRDSAYIRFVKDSLFHDSMIKHYIIDTIEFTENLSVNNSIVVAPRYKGLIDWPNSGFINNVKIKIIRSGYKNQLQDNIMNYSSLDNPLNNNILKETIKHGLNVNVNEYSNMNTNLLSFDSFINPNSYDSINPFITGDNNVNKVLNSYIYIENRLYNGNMRDAGVFKYHLPWKYNLQFGNNLLDTSFYCYRSDYFNDSSIYLKKYVIKGTIINSLRNSYIQFNTNNDPRWIKQSSVSKINPWGQPIEELNAIGVYSSVLFGYNQQNPILVTSNAQQPEILFDGFEDYELIKKNNALVYQHQSPLYNLFNNKLMNNRNYSIKDINSNSNKIVKGEAHTGNYSLEVLSNISIPIKVVNTFRKDVLHPFTVLNNKKYIVSYWFKPKNGVYNIPNGFESKSPIIEQWQLVESVINTGNLTNINISVPYNSYIDDIRIMPSDATGKSFVYDVFTNKLKATLDENHYATFFEYDKEGNLLRTKKETERGIMTINESRSSNAKK